MHFVSGNAWMHMCGGQRVWTYGLDGERVWEGEAHHRYLVRCNQPLRSAKNIIGFVPAAPSRELGKRSGAHRLDEQMMHVIADLGNPGYRRIFGLVRRTLAGVNRCGLTRWKAPIHTCGFSTTGIFVRVICLCAVAFPCFLLCTELLAVSGCIWLYPLVSRGLHYVCTVYPGRRCCMRFLVLSSSGPALDQLIVVARCG